MEAAEPQHLPPNASVNPAVSTSAGD
jgi:hypothetical protein